MEKINYQDTVHMDIDYIMQIIAKHMVKSKEIKDIFEKGFLSTDILHAFLKPEIPGTRPNETWYTRQILPETTNSIRVNSGMVYVVDGYNFLISDFYLICYKGNNDLYRDHITVEYRKGYRYDYWRNKENIYIVPLQKIEKFEIEFSDYNEKYGEFIERVAPEKRAFNGACLGMVFGGPAGAIFGAREFYKGAHDKVVTYTIRKNTYKLIIKFTDGDCIVIDDYWQTSGKENNKLAKMEKINREVAALIENSKLDLTDEQKKRKVNADIAGKSFSTVCGWIFIIAIFILFCIVCAG